MQRVLDKLIRDTARHAGKPKLYIVGGFLRDRLLQRDTSDADFVVDGSAVRMARRIASALGGTFVLLDESNSVYRVVVKSKGRACSLDFSGMRGGSIERDLSLRDFTVNALASELKAGGKPFDPGRIIDVTGGIRDMEKRVIRRVSGRVFRDDPLRILRAYRLRSELAGCGFTIEPATGRLIRKQAALIRKPSAERVRDELLKILSSDDSFAVISEIDRQKVLEKILPEISIMKRSARKFYYHPEGLWQHAKESLKALEYILGNLGKYGGGSRQRLSEAVMPGRAVLKLTLLLHDSGKPRTAKMISGRMRFFGHEELGAEITGRVFARLKMSRKETVSACKIVSNHMRPVNLSSAGRITERAIYRFFRDMGDVSLPLLLLSLADVSSYLPPFSTARRGRRSRQDIRFHNGFVRRMIKAYFRYEDKSSEKRLVNGNEVMRKFSIGPGPLVGGILKLVKEQQDLGRISTKKQALELAGRNLAKLRKNARGVPG